MSNNKPATESALERSSKLPDEILAAHQSRSDFLKWKLVLVAALGTAGFGLWDSKAQPAHLFLALIPFVCIYVDLLCTNLKVRIIVIGAFYAESRRDLYERFTQRNRAVFEMEDWALYSSTYGVCFLLLCIGYLSQTLATDSWQWPSLEDVILIGAGWAGIILSWCTSKVSKRLIENLAPVTDAPETRNRKMAGLMRAEYTAAELNRLREFLEQKGAFLFKSLPNGLFPAAASAQSGDASGYQFVWVRDNVHVAHAHFVCGETKAAGRTLSALMRYFQKYIQRFRDIIADPGKATEKALAANPMHRPHVRFDGRELAELSKKWPHAQNDALGYFLWCYCKLARKGIVPCGEKELECLAEFPLYFEAIEYWQDQDSGHWEETRKVSASSIGTVIAGLREFKILMDEKHLWDNPIMAGHKLDAGRMEKLIKPGREALAKILPCESIKPENCYRRYDSSLLFLIYPLEVLKWDEPWVRMILEDVKSRLQGDYGIRRYLGDSYWFRDYKKVPASKRTADYSEEIEKRDALVRVGEEAQWCIFDPIISVIYGQRYLEMKAAGEEANELLRLQTAYFNRALGQLTSRSIGVPELRAPEAYYIENGHYVPNDHTPLLWTQANLRLAMHQMQRCVACSSKTDPGSYEV